MNIIYIYEYIYYNMIYVCVVMYVYIFIHILREVIQRMRLCILVVWCYLLMFHRWNVLLTGAI